MPQVMIFRGVKAQNLIRSRVSGTAFCLPGELLSGDLLYRQCLSACVHTAFGATAHSHGAPLHLIRSLRYRWCRYQDGTTYPQRGLSRCSLGHYTRLTSNDGSSSFCFAHS